MKLAVFSRQAQRDLRAIARYLADESGNRPTATRFIRKLRERCHRLAAYDATLGRPRDHFQPGLRSVAFKSYVIFFRYHDSDVEIVTIVHGMRDIDAMFEDDD
jgi:toxin ParE1/3/4